METVFNLAFQISFCEVPKTRDIQDMAHIATTIADLYRSGTYIVLLWLGSDKKKLA